jgi:hypothetical protein
VTACAFPTLSAKQIGQLWRSRGADALKFDFPFVACAGSSPTPHAVDALLLVGPLKAEFPSDYL